MFRPMPSCHAPTISLTPEAARLVMRAEPSLDFQLLFEALPGARLAVAAHSGHVVVAVSDEYLRATMTERGAVLGQGLFDVFPDNPAVRSADGVANLRASLARVAATGKTDRMPLQRYDMRGPNGVFEERWWQPVNLPVPDVSGGVVHILHTVEDATTSVRERRDATDALRALVSASSEVLYRLNPDWTEMRQLSGGGFLSDTGAPNRFWLEEYIHPDDQARVLAAIQEAVRTRSVFELEHRVRRADGTLGWTQSRAVPLLDPDGGIREWFGAASDVTARKEAEAALHHANETLEARVAERTAELIQAADALHAAAAARAQVEEALHQSQKMETVGQLTGGIAHDFNNMLQAIGGSLDMLQRRMAQGRTADVDRYAEGARKTLDRAAALTHRLLAFARRQALQPKAVEPNELIVGMAELVRRTVGPGITVDLRLGDGIRSVLCDPSQLENALLNVAINARDAMPEGGRLTIRTADQRLTAADVVGQDEARPGDYVEVSVADSGTGMDEATRARAFEPFFTTKPIGLGTGLGLSQVYGFVRQSGGIVLLDSAPGRGTVVRLYLPRREAISGTEQVGPGAATDAPQAAAGEVLLLVEDEAEVRTVAAEHLRDMGYRVLEAEDGPGALRLLREAPRVDLLVSDVGLPGGLNGRQVADAARERRPGLPVLFITGYAGTFLDGQLGPDMAVLGKPFALEALAARTRAMLEAAPAA